MQVIYAHQRLERIDVKPSIFLVGPSPRSVSVRSWRPDALKVLLELGFRGIVIVPEPKDANWKGEYLDQVEWEREGLEAATIIAAWVPRDLETLPGFTTNVEFGRYVTSGRLLYGRPSDAPKTKYLDWLYKKETGRDPHQTLESLLNQSVEFCGDWR